MVVVLPQEVDNDVSTPAKPLLLQAHSGGFSLFMTP